MKIVNFAVLFSFLLCVCTVCMSVLYTTAAGYVFGFSCNTVVGNKQLGTQNHYCMSRDPGLDTRLLPDQFLC